MTKADLYSRPTAVYRLYDAAGKLLYVGVTWDAEFRFAEHARKKPWWPSVARHEVVLHDQRWSALREEEDAIILESPTYNFVGTVDSTGYVRQVKDGQQLGATTAPRSKKRLMPACEPLNTVPRGASVIETVARFVARIEPARRVREMSQQDLADACGLSRQVVSKLETGRQTVGLDDAVAICKALDVSLTDMLSTEPMVLTVRVPVD